MLRGFAITVIYLGALFVILFTSAGGMDWWMGWTVLGIYSAISQRCLCFSPGVSFLFFYPFTLAVAGVDVGRFGWTPSLLLAVQIVAVVAFALGNGLGPRAVVSNRCFSTFVRIQEERGQAVMREGPYCYVRHPGYAGTVLAAIRAGLVRW